MKRLPKKFLAKLSTLNSHFSILQKGFTLIELLVVIAVIGVLAAIVLLAVNPGEQLARARDTSRISAVTQLGRALQGYYTAQGATYPAPGNTWITTIIDTGDLKTAPTNPTYTSFPVTAATICTYTSYSQPNNATGYCYRRNTAGTEAIVYQRLESILNDSKCTTAADAAFIVFSTAQARAGIMCVAVSAEPDPDAAITLL